MSETPRRFLSGNEAQRPCVGSGRDFHSVVRLTLDAEIGCGIVIGEAIISNRCGHTIIDFDADARRCACGQRGHLDAYASATAVIQRTREALAAGRDSSLRKQIGAGRELTPELIAAEAEKGDDLSREIIMETARYLGIGLVNLMHTVDPNGILLGGPMTFGGSESEVGRRFLAGIKEEVKQRAFALLAERTVIAYAAPGGDGG